MTEVIPPKELGRTGMRITPVGLGTWAIGGGGWRFAWGPQEDERSIAAIHRAVELGINWIDTAPVYGTGHSEEVIGGALGGEKNRPYVFTKVSLIWDASRHVSSSLKADSIRKEVELSLKRLRVEALDLCQIHWPKEQKENVEGWRTLAELKDAGKIRHMGVSNFSMEQMESIRSIAPIETLQPPYSLIRREVEMEILPYAKEHGIGVIAYSPMGCGLLTGTMTSERVRKMPDDDWRRRDPEFKEPRLSRNLQLARLLGEIGRPKGCSAAEVAIAWVLRNPAVTGAIVGARSPQQVDGFVGAAKVSLTKENLDRISTFMLGNP